MPVVLGNGKIYVGDSKQIPKIWTNSKIGHYGFQGTSWDWSHIYFSGVSNSFSFYSNSEKNGLQGDLSIGTGSVSSAYPDPQSTYDLNSKIYKVDPTGGTGQFSMIGRDYSYMFKLGPIFCTYQYTTKDNEMKFSEIKFLFSDISNSTKNTSTTLFPSSGNTGNTYIQTHYLNVIRPETINGTNAPSNTNTSDYTLFFDLGPNNTTESVYTDVVLVGFFNESNNSEFFQDSSIFGENIIRHNRYVPWTTSSLNLDSERSLSGTLPKDMTILKLWQNPNILFYTHLKFINPQYTNYDEQPTNANILEKLFVDWSESQADILLYIEFGVSADGGKNIWWNGYESVYSETGDLGKNLVNNGITSIVPDNINEYLDATLLNYSYKPTGEYNQNPGNTEGRYHISTTKATVYGNNPFKYVRIPIWTDNKNDNESNCSEDRYQHFKPIDFIQLYTDSTATHKEDPNVDINTYKYLNSYWAKSESNSVSLIKYHIGMKYRTNPWSTDIHIKLSYEKDSLKYEGATDGK